MNPINTLAVVLLGLVIAMVIADLLSAFALLIGWIWLQLFDRPKEQDDKPPKFY